MIKKGLTLLLGLLVLSVFAVRTPAQEITVVIPPEVEVSSTQITLGDIASINGIDEGYGQQLLELEIKQRAFVTGYQDKIRRSSVAMLLKQNDFLETEVMLEMPAETVLQLKTEELDYDILRDKIADYIADDLELAREKIAMDMFLNPGTVTIPQKGEIKLTDINTSGIPGSINPRVNIYFEGQLRQTLYLGFDVSLQQDVYLAREEIHPGGRLNRDDFEKKQIKLEAVAPNRLISEWDSEVFREAEAASRIKEGAFLKIEDIAYENSPYRSGFDVEHDFDDPENNQFQKEQEEVVIRWGDELTASVNVGSINISTIVRARETGTVGDTIEVENLESGEIITGRIINSEEVIVE